MMIKAALVMREWNATMLRCESVSVEGVKRSMGIECRRRLSVDVSVEKVCQLTGSATGPSQARRARGGAQSCDYCPSEVGVETAEI